MKNQTSKISLALTAVLLLPALLAGCSTSQPAPAKDTAAPGTASPQAKTTPQETIQLRFGWWGAQDRHDRTLKVIELYEKQNPHVKISPEFAGNDGYWEKMATQAAGKNLPDIMQMSLLYLSEYKDRGLVANMDPFVKSGVLDLSDVDGVYTSSGKLNNALYALNIGSNSMAMAVDPELYKKAGVPLPPPGQTWKQYMDEARKLKAALGTGTYVKGASSFPGFNYYLNGSGQKLYNAEGTALAFDKKYLIEFYTMFKTLMDEGVYPPPQVSANVKALEDELIVHGKAPNQELYSNQIVSLTKAAGRPLKLAMIPIVEGEGKNKSYFIRAGQFLSISANSRNTEEAAKFVSFFTNSLEANEILNAERGIPVAAKVRKFLYPKLDPASQEMFDFLEIAAKYAGEDVPRPKGESNIIAAYLRGLETISYGQATPEKAANDFIDAANKILEKNKK